MRYGLILLVVFALPLSWAQRDPFAYDTETKSVAPLYSHPLASLTVVGVIIADGKALAIVRAPDETLHIVGVGGLLGEEKKPIASIDALGIHIDGAEGLLLPYKE